MDLTSVGSSGAAAMASAQAGRLHAVGLLAAPTIDAQHRCAAAMVAALDRAVAALGGAAIVCWPEGGRPPELELLSEDPVDGLRRARFAPLRVLRGPRSVPLDPAFERGASLFADRPPASPAQVHPVPGLDFVPGLGLLALQESMAAQVCALCIVEHDGLPLAFHQDLARQALDEARHARFFLRAARELLPAFVEAAPEGHPDRAAAVRFLATGVGLRVPLEGAFYEAFWATDLLSRLVLLHLDDEAEAARRFETMLGAALQARSPALAAELTLIQHDEERHAAMGGRWVEALLPDPGHRALEIARIRRLRAVTLLIGAAASREQPVEQLLRWAAEKGAALAAGR